MDRQSKKLYSLIAGFFNKLGKNVFWLIGLNVITALNQFVVYALINKNLGKEVLGVWSLVIAATAIGQISSFGFSNGLIIYLPEMLVKNNKTGISKLIGTVNLSNMLFSLPALFILFFPALMYAKSLLNIQQVNIFKEVFIWYIGALFINNLFTVYACLFDGLQQYYNRCIIQICGSILFLIQCVILIPKLGLIGVAVAYFTQNIVQLMASVIIAKKTNILEYSMPFCFDQASFKLISVFGAKSQAIGILTLFFDPVVKYFITKKMGLVGVANYELANKISIQARNIFVSANQVIVPRVVIEKSKANLNNYFEMQGKKNNSIAILLGLLVLLGAPIAILIIYGHFDAQLMDYIVVVNFGWVCNMFIILHYNTSIGLNKLNDLIILHLINPFLIIVSCILISKYSLLNLLFFITPALALFITGIYISFRISKVVTTSFAWLKSFSFLYFLLVSAITFFMEQQYLFLSSALFLVLFIFYTIKSFRGINLLKF